MDRLQQQILPAKLFGVNLPQTNRLKLRNQIRHLSKNQKASLYFFYSEFLLRANRNTKYAEVLNRATITAIDGKGLHWSEWRVMKPGCLVRFYTKIFSTLPCIIRDIAFPIIFTIKLVWNVVLSTICLLFNVTLTKRTDNEVILGRDFSYDLLTLAEENHWKVLIIGGSSQNDEMLTNIITKLYPSLKLDIWSKSANSDLMQDKPCKNQDFASLNTHNLFEYFPDLLEARNHITLFQPDLILVCLGGASGKQEFFIDNICQDELINFTLATGIGAALDHLGAGAKQPKAPRWLLNLGLEWFYRFLTQPYRRKRILDSVFTLWWWTTLQEFMTPAKTSKQFVNIIKSQDNHFLVKKTSSGYEFMLIPISKKNSIKNNFYKTTKLTHLSFNLLDFDPKPTRLATEKLTVKMSIFAKYLFKYSSLEPYICQINYSNLPSDSRLPKNFYWLKPQELERSLSHLHQKYWQTYLHHHKSS